MSEEQAKKRFDGIIPILVIVIFLAAVILRVIDWSAPAQTIPLLSEASGLVQLVHLEDIANYTQTTVFPPSETFGANLHIIGVYPEINSVFPKNTVALVYVKENWRFVEIDYKTEITLQEQLALYQNAPKRDVVLSEDIKGILITIPALEHCLRPPEGTIGMCQIAKSLIFEKDDVIIVVSSDGAGATDGELLNIAKSILK